MKIEERIKKLIKKSDNIFIISHRNLDLDAIGACIGVSALVNKFNKDNYIIIDDLESELGVSKILNERKRKNKIISSTKIDKYLKNNSLLIIVDTNKSEMLQNPIVASLFNNIVIIDHHQITDSTIDGIRLIDRSKSSACEIVSYLSRLYSVELTKDEATILLSGMVLDTQNFKKKTTQHTFYEAYYLTSIGADTKKVDYYLKEDLKDYIIRHKVIMNVEVIHDKFALAVANTKDKYKREDLAKIADILLNFNDIEASFVIGKRIDGGIGISARSFGTKDVGKIMLKLNGGGDIFNAACHLTDAKLEDVKEELIKVLNKEV